MAPVKRKRHAKASGPAKRPLISSSSKRTPVSAAKPSTNPFEQRWARSVKTEARRQAHSNSRNKFIDKRLAEKDPNATDADRYLLRLQRERTNRQKRADRFNILDRDDYDDVEPDGPKFSDGSGSDDEGEEDIDSGEGNTDLFTLKKTSAGGDATMKGNVDGVGEKLDNGEETDDLVSDGDDGLGVNDADDDNDSDAPKTKREVMDEIIHKSKAFKAERQHEKNKIDEQTARLDTGLPQIMELLHQSHSDHFSSSSASALREPPRPLPGDKPALGSHNGFKYESVYRELAEERRARPSNRLLTEEEEAEKERERLMELEEKRKSRMDSTEGDDVNGGADPQAKRILQGADDIDDDFEIKQDSLGESSSDDDDGDGHELKGSFANQNVDLVRDDDDDEKIVRKVPATENTVGTASAFWKALSEEDIIADATESREVPFVYRKCPSSALEIQELFASTTVSQRHTVIDRVRKCFALSLDAGRNRCKLERLTECLLFWIERLSEVGIDNLALAVEEMDMLLKHVHSLGSTFERVVSDWARAKVEERFRKLTDGNTSRLSANWGVSDVLVLRCLVYLFPSSDLRHGVVTPLMMLLSEALSPLRMVELRDVAVAVFVAHILMRALIGRRGYSPELAHFVCTVLLGCRNSAKKFRDGSVQRMHAIFAGVEDVVDTGVLKLSDCGRILESEDCHAQTAGQVLSSVLAIAEVMFSDWTPHADIVLASVRSSKIRMPSVRQRVEALKTNSAEGRQPLSLYVKKERVVMKSLNPKIRANEKGVFHKRGRLSYGGRGNVDDMKAASVRVKRAIRKEVRGMARDVRKEANLAASQQLAEEALRRERADEKDKKVRAFFEQQQSTWRQAEKKQKLMSGKKW